MLELFTGVTELSKVVKVVKVFVVVGKDTVVVVIVVEVVAEAGCEEVIQNGLQL